jgi:transposase
MENKSTKCSVIENQLIQLKVIAQNLFPTSNRELTLEELLMLKESLQSIQASVRDIDRLASSGIKQADRAINISRSERVKDIKKEQNLELLQLDITTLYQEAIKQKKLD